MLAARERVAGVIRVFSHEPLQEELERQEAVILADAQRQNVDVVFIGRAIEPRPEYPLGYFDIVEFENGVRVVKPYKRKRKYMEQYAQILKGSVKCSKKAM
jgi:hypothetical protein